MAGSKVDKDVYFGLTPSQLKLVIIGALCMEEGGKPDWERMSTKSGLTVSSVRSMYPKAMKRLRELHGSDNTTLDDNTINPNATEEGEASAEKPKPKKPRGPGRKRKRATEPAPEAERPEYAFGGVPVPAIEGIQHESEHEFGPQRDLAPTPKDDDGEHLNVETQLGNTQSASYDADDDLA